MASCQAGLGGSKYLAKGKASSAEFWCNFFHGGHARKISQIPPKKAISGCTRNVRAIQPVASQRRDSSKAAAAKIIVTAEMERGWRYCWKMYNFVPATGMVMRAVIIMTADH